MPAMYGFFVLFATLLGTAEACFGEQCQTKTVKSGSCKVEVKVCMCLFNLQKKYNAKATEKKSGKHSDTTSWHSSKDEAYEKAVKQLFNDKLVHDPSKPDESDYCSCQHADQLVGHCTIRGTACAMFNATADVKKGKLAYQAWATDMSTQKVGHVSKYADPTAAGTAAFMDLLKQHPEEAACLNGSSIPTIALVAAPEPIFNGTLEFDEATPVTIFNDTSAVNSAVDAPAATCDARSLIAKHEGKRLCVYKDTMGACARALAPYSPLPRQCARVGAQDTRPSESATTWTTPVRRARSRPSAPTTTRCALASSASRMRRS